MKFVLSSEQSFRFVEGFHENGRVKWTGHTKDALGFKSPKEAFEAVNTVPASSRVSVKIVDDDGTLYNVTKSKRTY